MTGFNPIIGRIAFELSCDSDAVDIARAILRREAKEPGSWLGGEDLDLDIADYFGLDRDDAAVLEATAEIVAAIASERADEQAAEADREALTDWK